MSRARWLRKPAGLSLGALKIWEHYAPGLWASGQLTAEKAEQFAMLCRLLATARAAADEIERFGVTIVTPSGSRRPNPACSVLLAVQKEAAPLLHEFGLG
jgi:phage terminase small subunit